MICTRLVRDDQNLVKVARRKELIDHRRDGIAGCVCAKTRGWRQRFRRCARSCQDSLLPERASASTRRDRSPFTRLFIHLSNSLAQFLTRLCAGDFSQPCAHETCTRMRMAHLHGQTTTARFAIGLPSKPHCRSVYRTVILWSVFPRPISSARMHPEPSYGRSPITDGRHTHTAST